MQTVIRSQFLFIASCGALALGGVVSACSSNSNNGNSSTNTDSGAESDGASSSGGSLDSSSGSSSSGSSSSGASEAGATAEDGSEGGACTTIDVMNFESWCAVSIAGAAAVAMPTYSACVAPGSMVIATAAPSNSTYELGPDPFVFVSEPGTVLDAGSPTATLGFTVVGTTPACILVCCPFSSNGTGCDSAFSGYSTWLADRCP